MKKEIIGHGTWLDKLAVKILEKERTLGRKPDIIRTESGLGASGFPTSEALRMQLGRME